MFGVDKGDQMRLHGGGFVRKAHHKKWHKKSFFVVLDCMLLNSLIAWNMFQLKKNRGCADKSFIDMTFVLGFVKHF